MKRVILAAVFLSALSFGYAAHATCVSVGDFNHATVSFADANGTVTIYAEQRGGALQGNVSVCDTPSAGTTPTHGRLIIKVNNIVKCDRSDVRLSADPFGFGSGVHAVDTAGIPSGACGADVSWAEIGSVPSADTVDASGPDDNGAHVGVTRSTPVAGKYWLSSPDATMDLPAGSSGTATRGTAVSAG